jgi:hypothetical protein
VGLVVRIAEHDIANEFAFVDRNDCSAGENLKMRINP